MRCIDDLAKDLIAEMAKFEIIDCHEHLGPEKSRVSQEVDVFTLFSHYTVGDLGVAGIKEHERGSLFNRDIPLERRWQTFKPYWERIRWASYARAALIAAKQFYGADDINDHTYKSITEAMQKANTPGIYTRVLGEACNIKTSLTQCFQTKFECPILRAVMPLFAGMRTWREFNRPDFDRDANNQTLDDYLESARRYVKRVKDEGAVGLKMMSYPSNPPNRKAALEIFNSLRDGSVEMVPPNSALMDCLVDHAISVCTEFDMVVCVHTGYWGDFRQLDPLHMIPILQRHPQARFDIYHVGYPFVRDALMLGKGFANVWLNFCWTHVISQRFATEALDEAVDLIPTNKILAFGGDYGTPVEKVYGHLVMAREDVARVLARRIGEGQFTESQALDIARKWFFDNPKELYRL